MKDKNNNIDAKSEKKTQSANQFSPKVTAALVAAAVASGTVGTALTVGGAKAVLLGAALPIFPH